MDTQTWKLTVIIAICLIEVATCVKFYWNIPTFMCHRHGLDFANITEEYGIIQNEGDTFRGNHISILYDPGYFPALLENSSSSKLVRRNGGVPQNGDVDRHLELFKLQLDELVPDKDNDGIIVIDFESWRPTFRQNFGVLKPYKDLSIDLARKEFPFNAEARAARAFEQYGKEFMLKTLKLAKQLRPRAQWGYYAFPYCFNGRNKNPERCAAGVNQENRNISWLFKHSDVIFPSVYMSEKMPVDYRIPMVRGRVDEAKRMSVYNSDSKIYTYFRHCYSDTRRNLEEQIVFGAMDAIKNGGSHGVILWGSSNDLNTRTKCENFAAYLKSTLGPVVQSFTDRPRIVPQL